MDDEELNKIRDQRKAQLRAAGRNAGGDRRMDGASEEQKQQQQQSKEREAEMRNSILSSVLTQEARARLSTIAAAKPERANIVENIIIQNARMGAIRGKVGEEQLKELLEKITSQTKRETSVKYERRRVFDDDDDDDDDDDVRSSRKRDESDDDDD